MNSYADRVSGIIKELGPLQAFSTLIAENDALIRSPDLDIGRRLVGERTTIYSELVRHWAEEQHQGFGYDKPFAVVALGGTGRGEMTPYSDNDFAFLFSDAIEGSEFLKHLQKQVLHSDDFESQCGFACEALPFSLEDIPDLDGKQLNSFLDMRAVYDPDGLTERFRDRIRDTFDPFEHFLHLRSHWVDQWEAASSNSENLKRFDIKNDGLRVFLAGIWTLAGKSFCHSEDIYSSLADPRDLEAYEYLLRIRAYIHSRLEVAGKGTSTGNHPEDMLTFEVYQSLGELAGPEASRAERFELGNEMRTRLLSARRRVAIFSKSIIRRELQQGRVASRDASIVCGLGGLRIDSPNTLIGDREKSRSALSLLLASQHYEVPVDLMAFQDTFYNAGDWLERVPELSSLFYESNGSLADSFAFLAQIDGAEERLFPGYAGFETSLDRRTRQEKTSLRGQFLQQKIRAFEKLVREGRTLLDQAVSKDTRSPFDPEFNLAIEAARLDPDHIAAIKLALKTKRLPLTAYDEALRANTSEKLYQRFASGLSDIPLADYYKPFLEEAGFSESCIELVHFLIANRRAFNEFALSGLNDDQQVKTFSKLTLDEAHLRALYVFTCADRTEWGNERVHPDRWFNMRELYGKALELYQPRPDPTRALLASGYTPDQLEILKNFGEDFFKGRYRAYANKFGSHLLRLAEDPNFNQPRAGIIRLGSSTILGLAARDFRGLAATITAELWRNEIGLRQAHFFSAVDYGLALDFFHLDVKNREVVDGLPQRIQAAIQERSHISEMDEDKLPPIHGNMSYKEWRPQQYCLSFEGTDESDGLVYALCYKLYFLLEADIFALTAHSASKKAFISIYHHLPPTTTAETARRIVEENM